MRKKREKRINIAVVKEAIEESSRYLGISKNNWGYASFYSEVLRRLDPGGGLPVPSITCLRYSGPVSGSSPLSGFWACYPPSKA